MSSSKGHCYDLHINVCSRERLGPRCVVELARRHHVWRMGIWGRSTSILMTFTLLVTMATEKTIWKYLTTMHFYSSLLYVVSILHAYV